MTKDFCDSPGVSVPLTLVVVVVVPLVAGPLVDPCGTEPFDCPFELGSEDSSLNVSFKLSLKFPVKTDHHHHHSRDHPD